MALGLSPQSHCRLFLDWAENRQPTTEFDSAAAGYMLDFVKNRYSPRNRAGQGTYDYRPDRSRIAAGCLPGIERVREPMLSGQVRHALSSGTADTERVREPTITDQIGHALPIGAAYSSPVQQ